MVSVVADFVYISVAWPHGYEHIVRLYYHSDLNDMGSIFSLLNYLVLLWYSLCKSNYQILVLHLNL